MRGLAIRGSAWTAVQLGAGQLMRLGGNIVLARLLVPEIFGLMALVRAFLQGLQMFSDVGLRPNVVRDQRGDDEAFLNTAWTIQAIRGIGLGLAASLIAWPISRAYGLPQLLWLLPVVAGSAVIDGFRSTSLLSMSRHLQLRGLVTLELSCQALGLVVMILWALVSPTVWALVAGRFAGIGARVVLSHVAFRTRNRFWWDAAAVRSFYSFGKWIFVSTAITFLALQADRLLLAAFAPIAVVGVYSIALMIATLPKTLISGVNSAVVFPAMARYHRQSLEALPARWRTARGILLRVAVLLVLSVVILAPPFVETLYDPLYHDAAWMAQWLSAAAWFAILRSTTEQGLLTVGKSGGVAAANAACFIGTASACVAGYLLWDMRGFILGCVLGSVAGYIAVQIAAADQKFASYYQDGGWTLLLVALALLGTVTPALIASPTDGSRAASIGIPLAILLGCGFWAGRHVYRIVAGP